MGWRESWWVEDEEERLREERSAQSASSGMEEWREALEALGGVMSR